MKSGNTQISKPKENTPKKNITVRTRGEKQCWHFQKKYRGPGNRLNETAKDLESTNAATTKN